MSVVEGWEGGVICPRLKPQRGGAWGARQGSLGQLWPRMKHCALAAEHHYAFDHPQRGVSESSLGPGSCVALWLLPGLLPRAQPSQSHPMQWGTESLGPTQESFAGYQPIPPPTSHVAMGHRCHLPELQLSHLEDVQASWCYHEIGHL